MLEKFGGFYDGGEDTSVDTTADNQNTDLTKDVVTSVDNWRDTLPQDIRDNKIIAETKDLTSLSKRLIDAQNYISKSVRLPDDGDTSGMDELYTKLGRPEAIDGYDVKRPDMPEGAKYDEGLEKSFLEAAHKVGLNSSQVNALMTWNQEQVMLQQNAGQKSSVEAMGELKKDWGTAFDERVGIAEEVLSQYGDDKTEALVKDNPALISLIYNMGKNLVEGMAEGKSNASHIRTPKEALDEINKLQRDPNFMKAYLSKKDPTHYAAVEQMRLLNVEAYPEPEAVVY